MNDRYMQSYSVHCIHNYIAALLYKFVLQAQLSSYHW